MNRLTLSLLASAAALSTIGAVQAADLIVDEPMMSSGVVDVGGRWEGVYLGAFVGGASGNIDDDQDGYWWDNNDSLDISGWLIGANAGANFYLTDGVVGGIVGDVAWTNISGDYKDYASYEINWQGSLRAKLGFDAGAFMPYVTGGLAVAHGTLDYNSSTTSETHIGWTVGAGVEVAVTDDLSIDALYRYSDYGSKGYLASSSQPGFSLTTHQVTVGLNWKF